MARLFGYCRKSTEEQNETSFEVQERKNLRKSIYTPIDKYSTFMIEYMCKRERRILPYKKS